MVGSRDWVTLAEGTILMRVAGQAFWLTLVLVIPAREAVSAAEDFSSKVVAVSDGDTITVMRDRTPVKIRLSGIDCPEAGQDFGSRAKSVTSELAFGRSSRSIQANRIATGGP
jgi:endonuclease YncB( thermonuclease family)